MEGPAHERALDDPALGERLVQAGGCRSMILAHSAMYGDAGS
jgi:hypothetical protein